MKKRQTKDSKFMMRVGKSDEKYINQLSRRFKMTKSCAILTLVRNYVLFDEIETLKKKVAK